MDPFLTEWNKMVTGKRYRAAMPQFQEGLRKAQLIVRRFNDMPPDDVDGRMALLRGFFAKCGERVQINQPMRCDWGCNISIGHDSGDDRQPCVHRPERQHLHRLPSARRRGAQHR